MNTRWQVSYRSTSYRRHTRTGGRTQIGSVVRSNHPDTPPNEPLDDGFERIADHWLTILPAVRPKQPRSTGGERRWPPRWLATIAVPARNQEDSCSLSEV